MKYYVINLPRCVDRKERLLQRLKYHNLLEDTTFINAIDKDSTLLDWFEKSVKHYVRSNRSEHACFLSHLKALREFIRDGGEEAIILEDDAMFHNDFTSKLADIRKSITQIKPNLVMLCSLPASFEGISTVKDHEQFKTITPKIFGAQAYWISREYAQLCLSRLDLPLRQIPESFVTSELITRMSGGYFIMPPVVIEEGVYSTLRVGNDLNVHRRIFSSHGLENYTAAEKDDITKIWQPVG